MERIENFRPSIENRHITAHPPTSQPEEKRVNRDRKESLKAIATARLRSQVTEKSAELQCNARCKCNAMPYSTKSLGGKKHNASIKEKQGIKIAASATTTTAIAPRPFFFVARAARKNQEYENKKRTIIIKCMKRVKNPATKHTPVELFVKGFPHPLGRGNQ
jgi:hypothetical protein